MRMRQLPTAFGLCVLLLAVSLRTEAQLRVVTANPTEAGVHELAGRFESETGHPVRVEVMGTGAINEFLGSDEPVDVVIGTPASLDLAAGQVVGTRVRIGRVGIGVMVRNGAPTPDVSTADALRRAALDADGVVYNTAGSGQYVDRMFDTLGIGEAVRAKSARPRNAGETIERMETGTGSEVGFGLLSEITPFDGEEIRIIGRLPEELQNYAVFEAVVLRRSADPDAAAAWVGYLTTPEAREVFASHGVD